MFKKLPSLLLIAASTSVFASPYYYFTAGPQTMSFRSELDFTRNALAEASDPSDPVSGGGSPTYQVQKHLVGDNISNSYQATLGLGYRLNLGDFVLSIEAYAANPLNKFDSINSTYTIASTDYTLFSASPSTDNPYAYQILLGYKVSQRYNMEIGFAQEFTQLDIDYSFSAQDFLLDGESNTVSNFLVQRSFSDDIETKKVSLVSHYLLTPKSSIRTGFQWTLSENQTFTSPFTSQEKDYPMNLAGALNVSTTLEGFSSTIGMSYTL